MGYRVYFRRSAYYPVPFNSSSFVTSSPNITWALITGLGPAQRYDVSVAAFTYKGEGPRSSLHYVTTGKNLMKSDSVDVKMLFCCVIAAASSDNRKTG